MEETRECDDKRKEGIVSTSSRCDNAVLKTVCFQGRMTGPTRRSAKGGWTEEEDKILAFAVQKFSGKNWKKIAECVPGRSDVQCLHRWQKVLHPDLVKGPWSKEEDDLICELVAKQGKKKWSEISKSLPGRIGKQCRERWHNHLNPNIKRTAWTKEEELILINAHQMYGNKWAEIAKLLPGRTENSIKNHWNCSVAKKITVFSSDLYTCETKAESTKPKEVKQNDDRRVNWEGSANDCSLDLVLGIAQGKDSNSKLPRTNDITKLPRTIFDNGSTVSPIRQGNFQKITHETSESLSGTLQLSLSTPSDVSSCNKTTSNFHQRPAFPDFGKRLSKSFSEPQYNVFSGDYFEIGNSKLGGQFKNSLSYGMTPEIHKENKVVGAAEDTIPGRLCYRPLQWKDLNILLKTDSFPDTDSYIQTTSSPTSFHTPPTQNKGVNVDCSSLDSILRSAARTFNTPSIIRKRRLQISEKTDNINHNDYNSDHSGSLSNEKQLVLPPLKSQKLETSAAKSIEKRLEHVFDAEWDSANIVSRTLVADDSFGANCGKYGSLDC